MHRSTEGVARILLAALLVVGCGRRHPTEQDPTPATLAEIPAPDPSALDPAVTEALELARARAGQSLERATGDRERAEVFGRLAKVYHAHDLAIPARAAYAAALRCDPGRGDLAYLAGRLELDRLELDAAATLLGRAVELRPRDAHALTALAEAERASGRGAAARARADAAVAVDPRFGPAWLALAETAADAGDVVASAEAYARFFALHPGASKYRVPYSRVLHAAGREEEAAAQLALRGEGVPTISDDRLAEVASLRVGSRTEASAAARLIEAGELDEAVRRLGAALAANPDDADARRNLAVALVRLGRADEAVPHLEAAVRLRPAGADERFTLGTVLATLGRAREAEAAYAAALELDPGHGDTLQNRGNLRLRSGRPGEALEDFRRLRTADPARPAAWLGTAAAEAALGREAAARATLEEGSRALPQEWRIAAAWCRLLSAARDAAVRDGARAAERARALVEQVRHPYALATLAMALAESGDFDGAVATQRQAIALTAPDSSAAFRAGLERELERYRRREPSRDPGLY